ncbi:MAG: sulfate permease [Saccharothrix sp.]|nr:sulfate permease [Saccharothrix sp.]
MTGRGTTPPGPPAAASTWLPVLGWLRGYRRSWLSTDLLAGLTVVALVVPEGMAYAQLAGLPPQTAFYAAPIALLCYALLGTSRQLVVSLSATVAVLSAATVSGLAATGTPEYAAFSAMLAILTGLAAVVAGVLRLGRFSQFFSESVLTGFVTGLALVIAIKQVPKILGTEGGGEGFFERCWIVITQLGDVHVLTLLTGLVAIAVITAIERFAKRVPASLAALVVGILLSAAFGLVDRGVEVVGDLPSGLAPPAIPHVPVGDLLTLAAGGVGIALVTFAEAIGVARGLARKHGYEVDPNAELRALGAANVGAGLFQGLPTGASLSNSAANDGAGARTSLSLMTAAVVTAVVALFLTGRFEPLPEATLGAIEIMAVSRMVKARELGRLWRTRRADFALAVVALVGVLVFDVLPGLAIAVVASVFVVIYRAAYARVSVLGREPGETGAVDLGLHPAAHPVPGVLVGRPNGPVFFANATLVRDWVVNRLDAADPPAHTVLLDLEATTDLDVPAADMLRELHSDLRERGVALRLARVHGPVRELLATTGLLGELGADHVHRTTADGIDRALAEDHDPPHRRPGAADR